MQARASTSDETNSLSTEAPRAPHPTLERWAQWHQLSETLRPIVLAPEQVGEFTSAVSSAAATLIELCRQDTDLGLFFMIHDRPDKLQNYSLLHAIHTGLLMALIGKRKDWGDVRTACGVSAALTMNLSIAQMQVEMALQTEPLNDQQKNAIHDHPKKSESLLRSLGVRDEEWLTAVLQHHEQTDGKGYPQGLDKVSLMADAIRTCDIFCAKISARASRHSMPTPHAAADIFRQRSAGYFGASIIREVGLYPPGCLVSLATGEQAVVIRRTSKPEQPDVVIIHDHDGHALTRPVRATTAVNGERAVMGVARNQSWMSRFAPETILAAS